MANRIKGILQSALQKLAISFSDILMPTIRSIVSKIQEQPDSESDQQ